MFCVILSLPPVEHGVGKCIISFWFILILLYFIQLLFYYLSLIKLCLYETNSKFMFFGNVGGECWSVNNNFMLYFVTQK